MADNAMRSFWPKITDEESAKAASRGGVAGAGIVVVATLGLVVWGLLGGTPIDNVGVSALIDVGLFLLIGFGIYRMSRLAAVTGLVLYLAELWFTLKNSGTSVNVVLPIIIILAFIGGIRGTFAYHRHKKQGNLNADAGV